MAAALLTMRPLFRWMLKDVKFPSYILKITSWKKSSNPSKSRSGVIRKDEQIELEYSNSSTLLQPPEPAKMKSLGGRDGFRRLEEEDVEDGTSDTMGTVRTNSEQDPWLTTALR